ncbi:MAG: AI-2E family transporter [Acidobacteria bacterium]|nr:AI-2E family transporter [Acidobacteriota bacterium]
MNPIKVASALIIITAVFALLILGKSLLIPMVIAVLVWYIIVTLAHRIGEIKPVKKYIPRWANTVIAGILIAIVLTFVGGLIAENAQNMVEALPRYQANVESLITRSEKTLHFDLAGLLGGGSDAAGSSFSGYFRKALEKANFAGIISSLVSTLSGIAGNAFLIVVYVIFIFFEQAAFPKKIRALFPDEGKYRHFEKVLDSVNEAIRAYISVKLTVSIITAVASYILMAIIGLDFAIFWAFLIFLLNFIPNIGSLIAMIFPAVIALIQYDTFSPFFVVLIGVGAIQLVVGNFLEPRMMGSSLNISSLVVILALSLWGALWGITGMILCVPITVIMMIIFAQFPATRPIAILLSEQGELMDSLEQIHDANEEVDQDLTGNASLEEVADGD